MENNFEDIVAAKPDEELLDMVYEIDKWNPEMLAAVEAELARRNKLPEDLAERKIRLIAEEDQYLQQGQEASLAGQIFGWLGVLGLIGLIIGYNYSFSKVKSKYTTNTYYKYDEPSRENGKYIFNTSLAAHVVGGLYLIIRFIDSTLY